MWMCKLKSKLPPQCSYKLVCFYHTQLRCKLGRDKWICERNLGFASPPLVVGTKSMFCKSQVTHRFGKHHVRTWRPRLFHEPLFRKDKQPLCELSDLYQCRDLVSTPLVKCLPMVTAQEIFEASLHIPLVRMPRREWCWHAPNLGSSLHEMYSNCCEEPFYRCVDALYQPRVTNLCDRFLVGFWVATLRRLYLSSSRQISGWLFNIIKIWF